MGWVCTCGTRLGDDLACPACGRRFAPATDGDAGLVEVL
jgi:hypothetical protein